MSLLTQGWNYLSIAIIFAAGLIICFYFGKKLTITLSKVLLLYIWHTTFCIIYYFYTDNNGGDAVDYFLHAKNNPLEFGVGTIFIRKMVYPLVNFFHLSMISTFLVFNIFGTIGLLFFSHCLFLATHQKKAYVKMLAWTIILLPSLSFWSSAIGKDSLSFLSISLLLWASLNLKKRLFTIVVAFTIMHT